MMDDKLNNPWSFFCADLASLVQYCHDLGPIFPSTALALYLCASKKGSSKLDHKRDSDIIGSFWLTFMSY